MSAVAARATLVHGYTMAQVDRMAHDAARRARGAAQLVDPVDAREEAWQAIVSLLYACEEKPSAWSLVDAGARAIGAFSNSYLRDRGLRQVKGQGGGYEYSPRFNAFWVHIVGAKPDWTDAIVQRMALPKVLAVLTPAQYEAVVALAAHDSLATAADALGIEYAAVKHRVNAARKKMLEAWFDDETPHTTSKKPAAEACRYGHSRKAHGYHNGAQWVCRLCLRAAGRRRRARDDDTELDLADPVVTDEPLTFAKPREYAEGELLTAADVCWCGLRYGHDWPHKGEGAPHPRAA